MRAPFTRPLVNRFRRLAGCDVPQLTSAAIDQWEIHPAETHEVPAVICLPDQAERITRTEFAPLEVVLKSLDGTRAEQVPATMAYRLGDVDLVDGVLYSGQSELHLRRRRRSPFASRRPQRSMSGALYETWVGNRWFGNWLLDDCATYRLADEVGRPVTSMPEPGGHVPRYEQLLSMSPKRVEDVHFDDLIIFDDHANNSGRMDRAQAMRRRLLNGRNLEPNPGVFLYRGRSGETRILENEDAIAEKLCIEYGFRIMAPEDHSVDELIEACGATRVIAGVEGSQLCHGLAVMPPGGTALTLQPPDRTTLALKVQTDRFQHQFSMLIGRGSARGFRVSWDEVQRTLALAA